MLCEYSNSFHKASRPCSGTSTSTCETVGGARRPPWRNKALSPALSTLGTCEAWGLMLEVVWQHGIAAAHAQPPLLGGKADINPGLVHVRYGVYQLCTVEYSSIGPRQNRKTATSMNILNSTHQNIKSHPPKHHNSSANCPTWHKHTDRWIKTFLGRPSHPRRRCFLAPNSESQNPRSSRPFKQRRHSALANAVNPSFT